MAGFNWGWSEKAQAKWSKIRQRGRGHYVLVSGGLGWGLWMFLAMALFPYLFDFPVQVHGDRLGHLLMGAIIWPLGGVCFGFFTWHTNEKHYRMFGAQAGQSRTMLR